MKILLFASLLLAAVGPFEKSQAQITVTAVNRLNTARESETIELSANALASLAEKDLMKLHVFDSAGKEVLAQAVDTDYDEYHKPDLLIFQANFAPNETKTFTISGGKKREYKKEDFRAYGRFVRERFDDFAWENDRVAHRTYGKALYHVDLGDAYSAGPTRGCGASGIWANGRLYVPTNFIDSRVLANGPIRVMFELVYEPFDVNGVSVSKVLRVSLDAGSQLNRFQDTYTAASRAEEFAVAVGLKKTKDEQKELNAERGWLAKWEPMDKDLGMQGLAILAGSHPIEQIVEEKLNHLAVMKPGINTPVTYWAGFAWDRAGHIPSSPAWKRYLDDFRERLNSPIAVTVK